MKVLVLAEYFSLREWFMKILSLCNNDLASLLALNLLMPGIKQHEVKVGLSSKVGGSTKHPAALEELAEYEKNILSNSNHLFFSQQEDYSSLQKLCFLTRSFQQIGTDYNTEINWLNDINQQAGIDRLKKYAPDIILSIRFGVILQQPAIDIPKLGVINLHSGLLPNYQGVMATFWAMLNNEKNIGCCLHYINDNQIDSGDIISQSLIAVDYEKSYLKNVLNVYVKGVSSMVSSVSRLNKGEALESKPQQGKSVYFGFPKQCDINSFLEKGYKLF